MVRKIIQLIDTPDSECIQGYLVALCDDGTIWFYQGGEWDLLEKQIPQRIITQK